MLSLNPPWYRVFERDNVTLTCNKNNLTEDSPTMWTHNGIRFSTNTANYNIVNASSQDSGEYRCCSQNLYWSNRVHLEVLKGKFWGYGNECLSHEEWSIGRWRKVGYYKGESIRVTFRASYSRLLHSSPTPTLYATFSPFSVFWPPLNIILIFYFFLSFLPRH